ncbi:hypothetical protein [Succiniclasticum ruminis]|uniref:Uncharacterized protein n=1 Tax=Succiniclasticum ruminis DSM 9236 TaxID=1123323 RepID=A0A1I1YAZ3_9FIRM|nr:hypothetical protein [Succiniclasticum ruminis]SFE16482.1 hypothetical protein SAMN05216245_102111 [Succiniclasticum ruminis DSM 9236]
MALNLTVTTKREKSSSSAIIILNADLPKNWKENLAAQKDQKYQELEKLWYQETYPEIKRQRSRELDQYWAKRRVELGFTEPEE